MTLRIPLACNDKTLARPNKSEPPATVTKVPPPNRRFPGGLVRLV